MKLLKLLKFCLIILIFIFTACESEDIDDNLINSSNPNVPETFSQYFGNDISRDFLGQIIDENHNPVSDVTISIGSDTAITDDNGVFIINNAEVKERFAYIKAEKPGYIHGSRSLAPSEGVNKVRINAAFIEDVDFSVFDNPSLNISAVNNDDCIFIFGVLDAQNLLGTYDSNLNFNDTDDTGFHIVTQECNSGIALGSEELSFNVTALGNPGEYIDINISGTVQDTLNVTHNFTGTIHVLRDE